MKKQIKQGANLKVGATVIALVVLGVFGYQMRGEVQGSQAFTIFPPHIPTDSIYVSDSFGASDNNTGLTPQDPLRSLHKASLVVKQQNGLIKYVNIIGDPNPDDATKLEYAVMTSDLQNIAGLTPIDFGNSLVAIRPNAPAKQIRLYNSNYQNGGGMLGLLGTGGVRVDGLWMDKMALKFDVNSIAYVNNCRFVMPGSYDGLVLDSVKRVVLTGNIFEPLDNTSEDLDQVDVFIPKDGTFTATGNAFTLPNLANPQSGDIFRALVLRVAKGTSGQATITGNTFKTFGTNSPVGANADVQKMGVWLEGGINVVANQNNFTYFNGMHQVLYSLGGTSENLTFGG